MEIDIIFTWCYYIMKFQFVQFINPNKIYLVFDSSLGALSWIRLSLRMSEAHNVIKDESFFRKKFCESAVLIIHTRKSLAMSLNREGNWIQYLRATTRQGIWLQEHRKT